ncbi:hypothetical protein WICMUC_000576 [Wickerhamomyces mucosus]|uniref:Uncharacterized protein n=1 Tax=Wickerhamomyces mucosus TaxID=1378264 RepID=A0A9P8PYQ2_9ASCO|nr:hypothetical protein WICMUC_000576 [Wickerhamomyces mucosus]
MALKYCSATDLTSGDETGFSDYQDIETEIESSELSDDDDDGNDGSSNDVKTLFDHRIKKKLHSKSTLKENFKPEIKNEIIEESENSKDKTEELKTLIENFEKMMLESKDFFNQFINKEGIKSIDHNNNVKIFPKINKLIDSNIELINSIPKDFGFKFLALCITCAFGGRKGFQRYSHQLSRFKIDQCLEKLIGCSNKNDKLNVTNLCYIGHIIIYYWGQREIRDCLCRKYGPLDEVIKSSRNIKREIGGENLWSKYKSEVHSKIKKDILKEYEERFQYDEENFEKIMEKLGISVK